MVFHLCNIIITCIQTNWLVDRSLLKISNRRILPVLGIWGPLVTLELLGTLGLLEILNLLELLDTLELLYGTKKPLQRPAVRMWELTEADEWKNISDGVKHLGEKKKKQGQGQDVKEEKGEGRGESGEGSEGQDEDSEDYVHVIYAKSSGCCNRNLVKAAKVNDELPNVISIRESSPRSSPPTDATLSEEEEPSYEDDFIIIEYENMHRALGIFPPRSMHPKSLLFLQLVSAML
ncbi:uncharacterized protein H6S33_010274 [Morchella sextelata]|uniref:uncharacterized protein n=1 Tax=Morchella sextelata TaxID=1174677 RepID=UPI001D03A8D0|nr:uncharacterized protein H6S33_010274 [Morchella sextelata]KAH0612222.1 hypothetical protein H6S33_010274 [Morchella sextelata]